MRNALLSIALILVTTFTYAQIPYYDSRDLVDSGIAMYDRGDYKNSIAQLSLVNECDTNYATALYELALSLQADSQFVKAKTEELAGLRLPKTDKRGFMLELASTDDYLQLEDSSLAMYDLLIKLYPYDNQAYYEKGIIYYRRQQYDDAVKYFERSLIINPTHFRSHYMLGNAFALQGRLSESMIALQTSLLMTTNAELARKTIGVISSITEETDDIVKYYKAKADKYSHPLFDDIDQLINAKIALNSDYQLKISLNDNIFRQTQVIMEKLKFDAADTNFVMQYYVPLLTQLYAQDMFEPYVLLLYSGYGFENVDDLTKKRQKDVSDVREIVFPYFTKIQSTRELNFQKRDKATEHYHYYQNDDMIIVGDSKGEGKEKVITGWVEMYHLNQTKFLEGTLDKLGNKTGWWNGYYFSGRLKSRDYYKNNEPADSSCYYFGNGNLNEVTVRDAEGKAKLDYEYDYNGWLSYLRKRLTDKNASEISYYANGKIEDTLYYEDGKVRDGKYALYNKFGGVKKRESFKDGKLDGMLTTYFRNGKIDEEAIYDDGKLNGPYSGYYNTGKIREKSTYVNDKTEGDYTEYSENGVITEKGTYSKGAKTEVYCYTDSGRLFKTMKLRNDIPYYIKFTDEDNKVVYEKEDNDGMHAYPLYNDNGNLAVNMTINDKGYRDGTLTFYYYTGAKSEESTYKDGQLEGKSVTYFKNGKLSRECYYVSNERDGYYKGYYANGTTEEEGWYKAGKKQGLWRYYCVNGRVKSEKYYLNDNINGYTKYYDINGVLTDKYLFDFGALAGIVCYDTAGNVTDSTYYPGESGEFKLRHFGTAGSRNDISFHTRFGNIDGKSVNNYYNGVVKDDENFRDGYRDSLCISYFPDGTAVSKGSYMLGDKVGKWDYFDESGQETVDEVYTAEGERTGPSHLLANGHVHVEYNFTKGEKDGPQYYYGEDGRKALVLYFRDGDVVGYAYEGKDGNLIPMIKLKNGSGKIAAVYANGQKSAEAELVENVVNGKMIIYYSNGKTAEERHYKGFDLDGPFRRYNPDGTLVYDAVYKDDELEGPELTYDAKGNLLIKANYICGTKNGPVTVVSPTSGKTNTYYYHYGTLTKTTE